MELSDSDLRYDREDAISIALAQALGLIVGVLATLVCGAHYVGVVGDFGVEFQIPFSGILGPALVVFAATWALALPVRLRHLWLDMRVRARIIAGQAQVAITAAMAALAGYLLAGARADLLTPGQSILTWLCYGLIAGGFVQAALAAVAFSLLLLNREMPDIGD